MLFEYKAVSAEGRRVFGRIDAVNLIDLEMRLKRMDLDLITGQPILYRSLFGGGRIPRRELINFCFHLEQLTASGVAILDGLADLRDSLEHPRFREIVAGVIESIEGGQTLSQALSSHPNVFSQVFVSLIRAGEASGDLPQVLASLTESLKWEDELAAHTKKLMLYPAFVGTVVLTATTFLMLYLVPQLKVFVRNMGQSLPPQTKLLFFVSDTLITFWPLLIAIPVVAALGLQVAVQSNPLTRIWLDGVILRLPVVGEIAASATALANSMRDAGTPWNWRYVRSPPARSMRMAPLHASAETRQSRRSTRCTSGRPAPSIAYFMMSSRPGTTR